MTIDNKFYSITQTNANLNSQNSVLPQQEFSQILSQTMQSKETQNQAQFSGNTRQDLKNGLISDEEFEAVNLVMDGAMMVVGDDLAWKMGQNPKSANYDFNFDERSGRIKQMETLANGDKTEREQLLRAYKQALENNRVIPQDGRQGLNVAMNYINKALGDL